MKTTAMGIAQSACSLRQYSTMIGTPARALTPLTKDGKLKMDGTGVSLDVDDLDVGYGGFDLEYTFRQGVRQRLASSTSTSTSKSTI